MSWESDIYEALLEKLGGDPGEVFNQTESARAGRPSAIPRSSPEDLVALNRYAQSADVPATALLAAPYEALKGLEQHTGIPALSTSAAVMNKIGVPVSPPDETTSPASWRNVRASLAGAARGLTPSFAERLVRALGE